MAGFGLPGLVEGAACWLARSTGPEDGTLLLAVGVSGALTGMDCQGGPRSWSRAGRRLGHLRVGNWGEMGIDGRGQPSHCCRPSCQPFAWRVGGRRGPGANAGSSCMHLCWCPRGLLSKEGPQASQDLSTSSSTERRDLAHAQLLPGHLQGQQRHHPEATPMPPGADAHLCQWLPCREDV